MQRETIIGRWCVRAIEAAWLLALTLVPIYFNLYSSRHFEPDKAAVLRTLALLAAAAGLVRGLDLLLRQGEREAVENSAGPPLWRRFAAVPLAVPTLGYALVFLLTTATSVVPSTSFWGSYQRLQGTYTNLSYILLFVMLVVTLRTRAQLERAVTLTLAASTAVAGYGVLQHFQLDPLPWRGDVIARVASTMGNSIFVAAYMIMVVPLALYRVIVGLSAAREAPPAGSSGRNEWLWAVARGLFLLGGLLLILTVIKFGAAVRTVDFRYWWVFPGAVICATALWWLLSIGVERSGERIPAWPGLLLLGFLLLFGVQFALSTGAQAFADAQSGQRALDWWIWLIASVGAVSIAYGLALTLPRLAFAPSRLGLRINAVAAGAVALLLLVTIFFTQSRGPWIGGGVGLFVFFTLLLLQARAQARSRGDQRLAGRLRLLLTLWVSLSLAVGGFLIAFNLSDGPFFAQLRNVPYLGRMGRLLEVDSGTGLVRRLIWAGDEHGGGAIGLITANPLRTLIGWGPESMFVAFNPFYPPSLANIEARGASPDRSHQAILDELVTKGLLGLASYLFLLLSFVALSWKLIRRSADWSWQVFFIACLSAVVGSFFEGLVGIPIVSTLMMFWVTLGLAVTGGALAEQYRLSLAPAPLPAGPESVAVGAPPVPAGALRPAPAGVPRPVAAARPAPRATGRGRAQTTVRGGAVARGVSRSRAGTASVGGAGLLVYALVALVALVGTWWFNLNPIHADMRFQQGQGLSESSVSLDRLVQSLDEYLATVRDNPREDFYYLNLGRSLMTLADVLRGQGADLGQPVATVNVNDLLNLRDTTALVGFVQRTPPMAMMSYAEAVLLRAHDLNPLNKDHFANLGRLNSYWYSWTSDPQRLRDSLGWYEQVASIAPQDVTLINERAGVMVQLGDYAATNGDQAQATGYYQQAEELLRRSAQLDARYADTYLRLGDLARVKDNNLDAATDAYVQAIGLSGAQVAGSIERIAEALGERADLIGRLRAAYAEHAAQQEARIRSVEAQPDTGMDLGAMRQSVALLNTVTGLLAVRAGDLPGSLEPYRRAVELAPANSDYSRNYSLVLSDTRRYDDAIAEANRVLGTLQRQSGREQEINDVQQLLAVLEQRRAGQ